jgi:hypothetical protein
LIVVLQADTAEDDEQIVAPLTFASAGLLSRMRPLVGHDEEDFIVVMRLQGLVSRRLLRHSGRVDRTVLGQPEPSIGLAVLRDLME